MSDVRDSLLKSLNDKELIHYFYLDLESCDQLAETLANVRLTDIGNDKVVPFNAKLRNYKGAVDQDGNPWLVKEVDTEEDLINHKLEQITYMIDYAMSTLAAPTILLKQDGTFYRATKVIKNAMQIGSYNYLDSPFKRILTNDLINRWLFFDEDRNPNNYLVLHNSKNKPLVVAIDYNKIDLRTTEMKIKGNDDQFGWFREGKTRFLTLLKPSNFENLSLQNFVRRLESMMELTEAELRCISEGVLANDVPHSGALVDLIVKNILFRREYINNYFRKNFKHEDVTFQDTQDDRYAGFGQSFLDQYKKKM